MKIEKLSDNKIRCTLTREDLQQRGLRLSELAYGTDKAKELFRDMMLQAQYQFGFSAENTPIMIEAIPMGGGNIVLIVTKVENPEELDTRFSSFAPSVQSDSMDKNREPSPFEQLLAAIRGQGEDGDGTADAAAFAEAREIKGSAAHGGRGLRPQDIKAYQNHLLTHRIYVFPSISAAADAARIVAPGFTGESALLVDQEEHAYYLFISMKDLSEVDAMQSRLAALSEYGRTSLSPYARMEHIREHGKTIIERDAIARLSEL